MNLTTYYANPVAGPSNADPWPEPPPTPFQNLEKFKGTLQNISPLQQAQRDEEPQAKGQRKQHSIIIMTSTPMKEKLEEAQKKGMLKKQKLK